MPELPEVETIRRALASHVVGRRIVEIRGNSVMMRRPLDPGHIRRRILGRRFRFPQRRGKYLILGTEPGDGALLIHLGMSGRLLIVSPDSEHVPHTHLTLVIDGGTELRLVDPRRFGFASWCDQDVEASDPSLLRLGPEPLDSAIADWLPPRLKARRGPLKSLLLDQTLVAGIGNIYATEALFRARIRPSRPGSRTSAKRLRALAREVRQVLVEAIEQGGTTLRDYTTPGGDLGYFAVRLQAYGRGGLPCPNCESPLVDEVICGRATVWCRRCQR